MGQEVWSSVEDHTLRIGGPRRGKTTSLAVHGITAQGALVTTSTKLDLAGMVHDARVVDEDGVPREVHILNLGQYGDLPSTVRWSILDGCGNWDVAARRAEVLIPKGGDEKSERWDSSARPVLAMHMHAAAVAGKRMGDVVRWLMARAGSPEASEVIDILRSVPDGGLARARSMTAHYALNPDTKTSIDNSAMRGLMWLNDPAARNLGDAAVGDDILDIERLLGQRETLHIIGGERRTDLAPLITAVVAEIAYVAKQMAGKSRAGRLEPPATFLLDEAPNVCPAPLDHWTADFGSRGLVLHIAAQSIAQMRDRWGEDGARTILSNCAVVMTFGGAKDEKELKGLSELFGTYRMKVVGPDHDKDKKSDGEKRGEYKWEPVLSVGALAALKRGEVACLVSGVRAVVGRAPEVMGVKGWRFVDLSAAARTPALPAWEPEPKMEPITEPLPVPVMARLEGEPA